MVTQNNFKTQPRKTVSSPRLGLTMKAGRQGGGMAARRARMNLGGVPGLAPSGSKLDFIHNKADELANNLKKEEEKSFES